MDTLSPGPNFYQRHKIFLKGMIMGFLIIIMIIPTVFVSNLVYERKSRQQEIVNEVSSKWAGEQTITGPYLYVPYTTVNVTGAGKTEEFIQHFWILPEVLNVNGYIDHQLRKRSIYNVLLYNANIKSTGNFIIKIPKDVGPDKIRWSDAQICYGISDFRGIQEKLIVNFKGKEYELAPGIPSPSISKKGLSAPVELSIADVNGSIPFGMRTKIKGSENINFLPLSGNSVFLINSSWASPSFNGSTLPDTRNVSDSGFAAEWKFSKANLPFNTVMKDANAADLDISFGITLLQPADQYVKTERSVKYAILFIGLTFGLFFIVEITQRKPVHPLQYILIGLALVIFYTLLLSLSEFIHFDAAYLASSVAVITMITLYAKQLFGNWKPALTAGSILTLQYGFIFILIRLEDTALLVGSIGLFIVLGLVMYASRKIDWYGKSAE
ncbi:MAG TPA: cell envelope integrity protein CreD [Flavitalea sp.]|nr:cell envelope integrity protein CreD [Flavitalea sp.]